MNNDVCEFLPADEPKQSTVGGGGGMGGDDARKNNEQHGVGCAARTSSCSDDGID